MSFIYVHSDIISIYITQFAKQFFLECAHLQKSVKLLLFALAEIQPTHELLIFRRQLIVLFHLALARLVCKKLALLLFRNLALFLRWETPPLLLKSRLF